MNPQGASQSVSLSLNRPPADLVRRALVCTILLVSAFCPIVVEFESRQGAGIHRQLADAAVADLVPTALTASYPELVIDFTGGFFFEAGLVVSWTVENQGPLSAIGFWRDNVYLSPTPTCCDQATLLQVAYGRTPLAVGETYTQEVAVIPNVPPGFYYVFVVVDAGRTFPETNEGNNQRSVRVSISLADLAVWKMTAPPSASTQQSITATWEVINYPTSVGSAPATVSSWQDDVYLSPTQPFEGCCPGATYLGSRIHTGGLDVGKSYAEELIFTVPNVPAGTYYVVAQADATNVQPEAGDYSWDSLPITITSPDLVPTALSGPPASASTQQSIPVSWVVKNQGTGPTVAPWQDNLYISPNPTCCADAMYLGSWPRTTPLVKAGIYTQPTTITVPNLAAGNYYLIVWTNATGTLHEENPGNNQRALPINITTPDLVPAALTAPTSAPTGQSVSVSWTVKNQGTGPTIGAWTDTLYVSPASTCCEAATVLGRFDRSQTAAGASYIQTKTVTVPSLPAGNYYLIIQTDSNNTLYERNETNNQRAVAFTITTPDLAPTAFAAPATVTVGQAMSISWTVKNQGSGSTVRTWTDVVYLSPTSTCCAGAIVLGQWNWLAAVASAASYTQTKTVTVPSLAGGSYYLILHTDAANTLYEANEANNERSIPLTVNAPKTIDLAPTALTAPASLAAQQAVSVSWTVKNQGTGPTVGAWTDTLYLSPTTSCCVGATVLGQLARSAPLASGASYTQAKTVTMPAIVAGSYYLIIETDSTSALYESNEDNNQHSIPITLTTPDLAPAALTAPEVASARKTISVSWTVQNRGTGPASGPWVDKVYISPDSTCCAGASLLGSWQRPVAPLAAAASYTQSKSVTVPALATGSYYVIVWTDADRQLYEANDTNNQRAAPISVTGTTPAATALAITTVNGGRHPAAGTGFTVVVEARDSTGASRTVTTATAVSLGLKSGTGLLSGTLTGTMAAGASQMTITGVTYTKAENGVVLTASRTSGDPLSAGDSASFTVDPGAASALAFAIQPGSALAGTVIPGPPAVRVQDGFGNTVTSSTASITIAIGTNPTEGTLSGTTTRAVTAGIASFQDLTIGQPGNGYTLAASSPALTAATSSTFSITASTGSISGRVTRASDGTPLSGAVMDMMQSGLVKGSMTTGGDGTYAISGLAPGSYDVRASAAGYQSQTQAGVTITAGGTAAVNFSLSSLPGPTIRITSPAAGSVIDRLTIVVRGEISAPAGTHVGVAVNGIPGFVDGGQFVALVSVDPTVTALTATASSFTGALATDSIPVTVQESAVDAPVGLRATPANGLAPLTVGFDLSAHFDVSQVALDVDGDGIQDFQGGSLAGVSFTLSRPGIYLPQATVSDLSGRVWTATTIIQVFDRAALDQRLQAVWRNVRDALRAGAVAGAVAFIHSDTREQYRAQFDQFGPSTLGGVDQIMTGIELVEVGFAAAQYEMLRSQDGQIFSYAVWFHLDEDGLWRLRRF